MDKLKLWIKKTKFKLFKKERERYTKTDLHYYDQYRHFKGITLSLPGFIPFKLFTSYNVSSFTYYAYWDKDGYLCEEDTQGYHNSKL